MPMPMPKPTDYADAIIAHRQVGGVVDADFLESLHEMLTDRWRDDKHDRQPDLKSLGRDLVRSQVKLNKAFDPSEPRDSDGKWTDGGAAVTPGEQELRDRDESGAGSASKAPAGGLVSGGKYYASGEDLPHEDAVKVDEFHKKQA